MYQVLITVTRGIIEEVIFYDDPQRAIEALAAYVKTMNPEHNDAALYGPDGLIANAKHFLDNDDHYQDNTPLVEEVVGEAMQPLYLIGNPTHHLGFMVVSPADPLAYTNPTEALTALAQMRQDWGSHLRLYRVVPVGGPLTKREHLERFHADCGEEGCDYSMVEDYLEKEEAPSPKQ